MMKAMLSRIILVGPPKVSVTKADHVDQDIEEHLFAACNQSGCTCSVVSICSFSL